MQLRHLEYLVALARERHFGRAAERCNVRQSTLSLGIKQLEDSLHMPIVVRNGRFVGLTPEGERVLKWARRVMHGHAELQQTWNRNQSELTGQLRLGMIPVSLPVAALLTGPLLKRHPGLTVTIRSLTSAEIQRGLDEFDLDAGLTYLDNEPLARVRRTLLYIERYFLVTPRDSVLGNRKTVPWAEARWHRIRSVCHIGPGTAGPRRASRIRSGGRAVTTARR